MGQIVDRLKREAGLLPPKPTSTEQSREEKEGERQRHRRKHRDHGRHRRHHGGGEADGVGGDAGLPRKPGHVHRRSRSDGHSSRRRDSLSKRRKDRPRSAAGEGLMIQ